jgi:radical SAM superfamily enzyme YgiQ (UPF0313 family)
VIKILLIMPDGRINRLPLGARGISFREAPLTLTHLAALSPPGLDTELTLVDRSIGDPIPWSRSFDLIGISIMTGTSEEGYRIAARWRARGVPVVLGGIHVTLMPEEARGHGDVIIRGFAEISWPRFLRDFAAGDWQEEYYEVVPDLAHLPVPRRDLQTHWGYMVPNTVMVTRGCRGACDFCSVPAAQFGFVKRPISEVIAEIRRIRCRRFAVSDVHVTDDPEYAKEFCTALIPLKKEWGALASTRVASDPELLRLLQRSGCRYLLLGFESLNGASLAAIHKRFNRTEKYRNIVDTLHSYGIAVQGCFIFGFDEDTSRVFRDTVDQVNQLGIDIPRYALFTPYPGTGAYKRLDAEDRLLHRCWEYYDTQHAVIVPRRLSPYELDRGLLYAYQKTFRIGPSIRRSLRSGGSPAVTFLGNLAYKLYVQRLKTDRRRFPPEIPAEAIYGKRVG